MSAASTIQDRVNQYLANGFVVQRATSPGGNGAIFFVEKGGEQFVVKSLQASKFKTSEKYNKGVRRLKREVDAMRLLAGRDCFPSLVDADLNVPCILMHFVDLGTLDSYCGGFNPDHPFTALQPPVAWTLFNRLLDALHVVHTNNIVHRDIKPNNILVAPDGSRLCLIDFGLCAPVAAAPPAADVDAESDVDLITTVNEGLANGMLALPEYAGTPQMADMKRLIVSDVTLAVGVLAYMRIGLRRCLSFSDARVLVTNCTLELTVLERALFAQTFVDDFSSRLQTVADVQAFVAQDEAALLACIASHGPQSFEEARMSQQGMLLSKTIAKMLRTTFEATTKMTNHDEKNGADFFDWGGQFEFRLYFGTITAKYVSAELTRSFEADDLAGLQEWLNEIKRTL
jgi:serine/threonine protein kinase